MPVVPDPSTLGEFPLFRGLTIEQLTRLNDLLRRRTFPAGTNLASAEEPGEVVYLILNGTVKIFVTQAESPSRTRVVADVIAVEPVHVPDTIAVVLPLTGVHARVTVADNVFDSLHEALAAIRERGHASDRDAENAGRRA